MPINLETVKTNIFNWAKLVLPVNTPVIMYYENAPRPPQNYVTINISSYVEIGEDYTPRPKINAGDVEQVGDREFTVQLQAYGGDAMGTLETLRYSLQKQTILDTLRVNGLVFAQQFPIVDITELVNSRFEPRASMDVLFRMAQTYGDTLGTIATVEIREQFLQGSVIVYDKTVTIPPTP